MATNSETGLVRSLATAAEHLEEVGTLAKVIGMFPSGSGMALVMPATYHLRGVERIRRTK